jgi:mono/diheme cytochrome c family protein
MKKNDVQVIEKVSLLTKDASYDVRVQLLLSLYNNKSEKATSIVNEILAQNASNEMLSATKVALDKNEDVRTFGNKLGNLAAADRALILKGAATFKSLCASCHGPDGKGLSVGGTAMAAPPLVKSKRLTYPEKNTAIRILLHGLSGPVDGQNYPSVMPPMEANSDEWIASVVSYIRLEFGGNPRTVPVTDGNKAGGFTMRKVLSPAITPEEVKKIREESRGRTKAWTLVELEAKSQEEAALQGSAEQRKN